MINKFRKKSSSLTEDQNRVDTVNIDTDDEDSCLEEINEDSVIDEEVDDIGEEHDDFEEITDQLSDIPDIALLPNSL